MSKETFKEFIRNKPYLIDYVNDNTMSWQKFYELYDLYGENNICFVKILQTPVSVFVNFSFEFAFYINQDSVGSKEVCKVILGKVCIFIV